MTAAHPRTPSNTTPHLDARYSPDPPQAKERSVTSRQGSIPILPCHRGGRAPSAHSAHARPRPSLAYLCLYPEEYPQAPRGQTFDAFTL